MKLKLIKTSGGPLSEMRADDAPCERIAKLAGRLRTIFPLTKVRSGDRGLTVFADGATGFPVTLELIDDAIAVSFGPGMIEFDCIETAFKHVILACSEATRLTVVPSGNRAKRWHLDGCEADGGWRCIFAGGFALFGFGVLGRTDETVVLRNRRSLPLMTSLSYGLPLGETTGPAA
jgi:hypothetical protein